MYAWTQDLATNNTTIDNEHKELIKAINELLDACSKGQGRAKLDQTTRFLYDYTSRHFAHEEQLQKESGYPGFTAHRQYHEGFKKVVKEICDELKAQGPTIALVGKVNSSIGGWLLNHIKREDTKVAAHIRNAACT